MPHVREREPNPDEPEDKTKKAAEQDTSSGADQTSDANVETDAASLDPQPGS